MPIKVYKNFDSKKEEGILYMIVAPGNSVVYGIYSTPELAIRNYPDEEDQEECWIIKVRLDERYDFMNENADFLEGDYHKMKAELIKKDSQ